MKATVVTALFDIGRKEFDGRGMEEYYEWFSKTLKLSCSMVIYCEESLNSFILENRPEGRETKIINQRLDEVPYFHLKPKMDELLNKAEYQAKVKDPHRIECKTSLYSIIQFSKFPWLNNAAEQNYFDTDYFVWMDAGFSRLVGDFDFGSSKDFPGNQFMNEISKHPGKSLIQAYVYPYSDLFSAERLPTEYFNDNRSYVMGGLFGTDRDGAKKLHKMIDEVLTCKMLPNDLLGNDQIALGYLLKERVSDFLVLVNVNTVHRNFELFYQMAQ